MQPDNSTFVGIHTTTQGPIAIIEMENGAKPRQKITFDLLDLNNTIQNIKKNLGNAKSETSREFHEAELSTFETALKNLREQKKIC